MIIIDICFLNLFNFLFLYHFKSWWFITSSNVNCWYNWCWLLFWFSFLNNLLFDWFWLWFWFLNHRFWFCLRLLNNWLLIHNRLRFLLWFLSLFRFNKWFSCLLIIKIQCVCIFVEFCKLFFFNWFHIILLLWFFYNCFWLFFFFWSWFLILIFLLGSWAILISLRSFSSCWLSAWILFTSFLFSSHCFYFYC